MPITCPLGNLEAGAEKKCRTQMLLAWRIGLPPRDSHIPPIGTARRKNHKFIKSKRNCDTYRTPYSSPHRKTLHAIVGKLWAEWHRWQRLHKRRQSAQRGASNPAPRLPRTANRGCRIHRKASTTCFTSLISAQNCRGVEGRVQTFIRGLAARGRIVVLGGHVRSLSTAGNPFAREFLAELPEKNG